jgi:hypothetical protein
MKITLTSILLILILSSCSSTKVLPIAEVTGDSNCVTHKKVGGAVMCYNGEGRYTELRERTTYTSTKVSAEHLHALAYGMRKFQEGLSNAPSTSIVPSYNSKPEKSQTFYDRSVCGGTVLNGVCHGVEKVLPSTPKYKCRGIVLHDGTCSGSLQRVY